MNKTPLLLALLFISHFSIAQTYTDVSMSSGVGFVHNAPTDLVEMPVGTGAVWFDYDNDNNIDLYVTQRIGANKLFKNNGDGTFTDVAVSMGVADSAHDGAGAVAGDINNDGYLDLYLANSDENVLFLNNQGTGFTDITVSSGLSAAGNNRSTSATFGDYDNDGHLDLYVSHHIPRIGFPGSTQDYLFYNNGDMTFTDVSTLLGITHLMDPGFIAGWTDYDGDDDLDLILINDCPFNTNFENDGTQIFRNDGGTDPITNWTFTEVADAVIGGDCSNGMGIAIGDYNRDGMFDIAYTNIGPATIWENQGTSFSQDLSAGVSTQPALHFSWGVSFMDYNNDGWQDLAMAVGSLTLNGAGDDSSQECNFFENQGDGTFNEIAGSLGLADTTRTRTLVHSDYDNDGDLDLLMVNYGGNVKLMRNDLNNSNNFVRIKLRSKKSAPNGIGAKLEVTTNDGVTQYFEMRSGSNLGGGDEILAHFGLGTASSITELKVNWPSGVVSTLNGVAMNTVHTVVEPNPYHYVCKTASGDNDGSNWANAYTKLESALASAMSGDTIFVADAVYYPTEQSESKPTFSIDKDIMIMGGFPSTGGGILQRDYSTKNTILSGDVGSQNAEVAFSYNVVTVLSSAQNFVLDGVMIRDGLANGTLIGEQKGAGISCFGKMTLVNSELDANNSLLSPNTVLVSGSGSEILFKDCTINNVDEAKQAVQVDDNGTIKVSGATSLTNE